MTKQLLIYSQAQAVNKQKHLEYSVKVSQDFSFAKDINSIPLTTVEFFNAASEYPVVFAGDDEKLMPVAVVGMHQNENLYINEDGTMAAKYVPAFLRRYPFVFSSDDDGENFILCVDEAYEGLNKEGKGERLFDSEGEQTQYLNGVLEFLKEYQQHFMRTQNFCKTLKDLDLLEPMQAQFNPPEAKAITVSGFMAINRKKLNDLPAEKLSELAKSGALELAYLQLHSMRNFTSMLERVKPQDQSDKAATESKDKDSTPTAKTSNGAGKPNGSAKPKNKDNAVA